MASRKTPLRKYKTIRQIMSAQASKLNKADLLLRVQHLEKALQEVNGQVMKQGTLFQKTPSPTFPPIQTSEKIDSELESLIIGWAQDHSFFLSEYLRKSLANRLVAKYNIAPTDSINKPSPEYIVGMMNNGVLKMFEQPDVFINHQRANHYANDKAKTFMKHFKVFKLVSLFEVVPPQPIQSTIVRKDFR